MKSFLIGLISIGLLCGTTHTATAHPLATTETFRQIEQPLSIRIGVTAVSLGLVGLELWWFLISKTK